MTREELNLLFNHLSQDKLIVQAEDEVWEVIKALNELQVKTILEIGTAMGGTAKIWSQVLNEDGLLITVDMTEPPEMIDLSQESATIIRVLKKDSQYPETVRYIAELIGERELDFLYIDADHSYAGIKSDYENYTLR